MRHLPLPVERTRPYRSNPIPWVALVFALTFACLLSLVPQRAFAQANAGITGTVTDSSGAVVAGIKKIGRAHV